MNTLIAVPERPTLSDLARIVELRTKIVSLSSLAIGTLWAAGQGAFDPLTFALMLAASLCVDLATAGFNSYYDHRDGVDTVETDVDRYKVLVHRRIDPRIAWRLSAGLFALAMLLGLLIGLRTGWEVIGIGAVCMLIAYGYSGGPWPISRTPVGELFAGGTMGALLIALAAYVHTKALSAALIWLGLPSTLLIAAILAANNACDRIGDAAAGRRTLAIVCGPRGAVWVVEALVAGGLLSAALLSTSSILPGLTLLPLAAVGLLAYRTLRGMRGRGYGHVSKGANMGGISLIFLSYSLVVCVALAYRLGAAG